MSLPLEQASSPFSDEAEQPTRLHAAVGPTCGQAGQRAPAVFRWVAARTATRRRVTEATTIYDCVRLAVIREGSLILTGDMDALPVSAGTVVLAAPGAAFGWQPEGRTVVTTVLLDTDYLVDVFFWQHLDRLADAAAARDLAARRYPEPVQVLRLGEPAVERLAPVLDGLVARTADGPDGAGFFGVQALVAELLAAITPHVHVDPDAAMPRPDGPRAGVRRWRVFRPAPPLIAQTALMMRADLAAQWRLADLAEHACFSRSQYVRRFTDAYGMSPFAYLTMLRVREMARLLRETDMPVLAIFERVGWGQTSHAAVAFRRYYGTTPSRYRTHGPATATGDGPGVAVARHAADHRSAGRGAYLPGDDSPSAPRRRRT